MSILPDHPTRARTAAPNLLDLLPVVLGLREPMARHGEVTIRVAECWATTVSRGSPTTPSTSPTTCPREEWRPTLVHERLHVVRGRFTDVQAEEALIRGVVGDVEALLTAAAAR